MGFLKFFLLVSLIAHTPCYASEAIKPLGSCAISFASFDKKTNFSEETFLAKKAEYQRFFSQSNSENLAPNPAPITLEEKLAFMEALGSKVNKNPSMPELRMNLAYIDDAGKARRISFLASLRNKRFLRTVQKANFEKLSHALLRNFATRLSLSRYSRDPNTVLAWLSTGPKRDVELIIAQKLDEEILRLGMKKFLQQWGWLPPQPGFLAKIFQTLGDNPALAKNLSFGLQLSSTAALQAGGLGLYPPTHLISLLKNMLTPELEKIAAVDGAEAIRPLVYAQAKDRVQAEKCLRLFEKVYVLAALAVATQSSYEKMQEDSKKAAIEQMDLLKNMFSFETVFAEWKKKFQNDYHRDPTPEEIEKFRQIMTEFPENMKN